MRSNPHKYAPEPNYEVPRCDGCGTSQGLNETLGVCEKCLTKMADRQNADSADREFLQLAGIEYFNAEGIRLATASHFARLLASTKVRALLSPSLRAGTTDDVDGEG